MRRDDPLSRRVIGTVVLLVGVLLGISAYNFVAHPHRMRAAERILAVRLPKAS